MSSGLCPSTARYVVSRSVLERFQAREFVSVVEASKTGHALVGVLPGRSVSNSYTGQWKKLDAAGIVECRALLASENQRTDRTRMHTWLVATLAKQLKLAR